VEFGRTMLEHVRTLANPDGALLMARVGVMVGLELPRMASSLGNHAFPHLPVDVRTQILGQLEQEAALGQVFEEVTPAMKPFWFERLRHANEAHDWNDPRSVRALDDLINRNRYLWQGWGIIQQLLPADRWSRVESRLRDQATIAAQSAPRKRVPLWLIAIPVVLVLNLLRMMSEYEPSSPSLPYLAPPLKPRFTQAMPPGLSTDATLLKGADPWTLPKQISTDIKVPVSTMVPLLEQPKPQPILAPDPLLPKLPPLGIPNLTPPGNTPLPPGARTNSDHLRSLLNGTPPAPRTN
jgi:hypothetical protein